MYVVCVYFIISFATIVMWSESDFTLAKKKQGGKETNTSVHTGTFGHVYTTADTVLEICT
jgi:hypothetical protein